MLFEKVRASIIVEHHSTLQYGGLSMCGGHGTMRRFRTSVPMNVDKYDWSVLSRSLCAAE
jgi:hypothetical protein